MRGEILICLILFTYDNQHRGSSYSDVKQIAVTLDSMQPPLFVLVSAAFILLLFLEIYFADYFVPEASNQSGKSSSSI